VTGNNADALIKPGEQASLPGNDQQLVVSRPDLAEVLAWRQGEFIFKNANIKAIMRQIARWYDVEVVYAGNMPDVGLSGSMHRSEYASQLLEALELTKDVHFKIEGRKVIVMSGAR
jgi:ferric-dicitrate binding protein FerR (iron transport regulator)